MGSSTRRGREEAAQARANRVPGTTETQHLFAEDREAVLRVLPDPEAVLSEQSSECFQAWWMMLAPESQL